MNLLELNNTYGTLISIDDIQMKCGTFYITAQTEKKGIIYFTTYGGDDGYRYDPDTLDWEFHINAGMKITATPFQETERTYSQENLYGRTAKKMYKKYGKLLSMKIIHHWKYCVDGLIFVEKRSTPMNIRLSECYDDFLKINTFATSWDDLYPHEQIPYIYKSQ